jgi:hypothetical protein
LGKVSIWGDGAGAIVGIAMTIQKPLILLRHGFKLGDRTFASLG